MVYFFFFWSFLLVLFSFVTRLLLKRKGVPVVSDNDPQTSGLDAVDHQQEEKYDVFVSFRGEDTRRGFLSHLAAAFHRKNIYTFVDERLQRGEEIWPSLVEAIEGSLISVIIFSKNYASSTWCLKELVKILECRDKYGHTVIPVFYEVDPTDVRHQKRSYESAFAEHRKNFDPTMLQIWRDALHKSASLSGIKSSDFGNEAELLEKIINDVLHQLRRLSKRTLNSKGLVGIDKPIADIEALLLKDSKDVRIIGIWGMGGIGKTTIAEQVFNKICSEYEGSCFFSNVREETARHGISNLKAKLFSRLIGEHVEMKSTDELPDHIRRRIGRMKVFIVLDDVNDSNQLELFGTVDNFGPGSRIIVTTRYKQLLLAKEVDGIHEVGVLSSGDAQKLFNLIAFSQSHLETQFHEKSEKLVDYAKGLPLVLKVLGKLLHGKGDDEVWESQLNKLKQMPSREVYDVLRLSYDDLDRTERRIFLDLACFFKGSDLKVDLLKTLLKDCESDNSVAHGLERLKDMALIVISEDGVVSMHDIIEEIAWEIVREESREDIGSQSRLRGADDFNKVLKNDKGIEVVRSIRVHSATMRNKKLLELSSQIFTKMSKLQFLDFYSAYVMPNDDVLLPKGLQSLPTELRYLRWWHYPLKSLPKKFRAEKLVILDLSDSDVTRLWHGVQNLVNLKQVKLSGCISLKELPDFSKATNLEVLDASCCIELTDVKSSVLSLAKLEKLDLSFCFLLTSLTSNAQLSCLSYLNLRACYDLTKFSVTSENMVELNLGSTKIKALPTSFGCQRKLEILYLDETRIESLPSCMVNLTKLRYLDLRSCSKLQTIPELPPSLETLLIDDCSSLKTVSFPSTATKQFQENKKRVEFFNCERLDEDSLMAIGLNARINVMKFAQQHLSALKLDYVENYDDYFQNYHFNQAVHAFPGSRVPEWLEYKTMGDSVIIDLSCPPPSPLFGFIFCFVNDKWPKYDELPRYCLELQFKFKLKFKFTISAGEDDAGEDKKDSIEVDMSLNPMHTRGDHVCVMYDQRCSRYLSRRSQNLSRFQIKVTLRYEDSDDEVHTMELKGFGVSLISTSKYDSFVRQME